jgi:AcrR family transcriptional regulator
MQVCSHDHPGNRNLGPDLDLTPDPNTFSAQGTRLNRRGRENRRAILATAVRCLSTGAPDAMSANRIAKEAGVTWGTIQHQFGDADGVWAAVLEHVAEQLSELRLSPMPAQRSVARQVSAIVEWMWKALDSAPARAVQTIRVGLPSDYDMLQANFPQTAAGLKHIDDAWSAMVAQSLAGLVASKTKLRRVRHLLPAAMHGIHMQAGLSSLTDAKEARRGLAEAVTAYLET